MSEDESLKSEGSVVTEDDVDSDGIASKIEETSSALPVNQKLALNNQVNNQNVDRQSL